MFWLQKMRVTETKNLAFYRGFLGKKLDFSLKMSRKTTGKRKICREFWQIIQSDFCIIHREMEILKANS